MTVQAASGGPQVGRGSGRYGFTLAGPGDDVDVRRLLRQSFGASMQLALTREPDAALGAGLQGAHHQCVLARERTSGTAVAMGCRTTSVRTVRGEAQSVGYHGEMRVASEHRAAPTLIRGGFRWMRRRHEEDGETRLYFASVARENELALRLFEAGLPDLPLCRTLGEIVTVVVRASRRRISLPPGVELRQAAASDRDEIVRCLERHGRRHDLAPHWTAADLASPTSARGLAPEHFFLATRAGRTVGCAALWDQRAFKQVVVTGYGRRLRLLRPGLNAWLTLTGRPALPPSGTELRQAFVSPCAIEDDDPAVLLALLGVLGGQARARGLEQIVLGLDARHPCLRAVTDALPTWRYATRILGLAWPEDRERLADWRPALLGPDIALL